MQVDGPLPTVALILENLTQSMQPSFDAFFPSNAKCQILLKVAALLCASVLMLPRGVLSWSLPVRLQHFRKRRNGFPFMVYLESFVSQCLPEELKMKLM